MRGMSLRKKIILSVFLPTLILVLTASKNLYQDFQDDISYRNVEKSFVLIEKASKIVHNMQVERGMSISYLSGANNLDGIKKQRTKVDGAIEEFKKAQSDHVLNPKFITEANELLVAIPALREKVNSKSIAKNLVLKTYTKTIYKLLSFENEIAKFTNDADLLKDLNAMRTLEEAKENGGKFRALVSAILVKNKAIDLKTYKKVLDLRYGYIYNVKVVALTAGAKSEDFFGKMKKGKEWAEMEDTFDKLTIKKDVGGYDADGAVFFKYMTKKLNDVNSHIWVFKEAFKKDLKKHLRETDIRVVYNLSLILIVLVLVFITFKYVILRTEKELEKVVNGFIDTIDKLSLTSNMLEDQSRKLTENSNDQSSSVEQTSAAVNEISATISQNAEYASKSEGVANEMEKASTEGEKRLSTMLESINAINSSSEKTLEQMKTNSDDFQRISEVISQIDEKTKVIHDIVFQTKLLSFNASVEAARAGEHGKGFAVVAEEVGNLASLSGNAAEEIGTLLEQSVQSVEQIVSKIQSNMVTLERENKDSIKKGLERARDCQDSLKEIHHKVRETKAMVKEIVHASKEQSIGVNEVNDAISQVSDSSNQIKSLAERANRSSNSVKTQTDLIKEGSVSLNAIIKGKSPS